MCYVNTHMFNRLLLNGTNRVVLINHGAATTWPPARHAASPRRAAWLQTTGVNTNGAAAKVIDEC